MIAPNADSKFKLNLDRCAQEPIHIIGSIQPYGVLFALSEPDLVVRQVSANVLDLCGISSDSVLSRSFEVVLGAPQFEVFESLVMSGFALPFNPTFVSLGGTAVKAEYLIHRHDGVLIVELELQEEVEPFTPLDVDRHIRGPVLRMHAATDILDLARVAADEVRQLLGFERVSIYRFEEDWTGDVIAESVDSTSVYYLGLRFPASDVPVQARQLLLVNPLRTIVDVKAMPSPIVPEISPVTGRPLDLSLSFLRSASRIHLEYLSNMGVQSSLSISIVVKSKLWGVITCHHPTPRPIGRATRSIGELLSKLLASQVALRSDNAALQFQLDAGRQIAAFIKKLQARDSPPSASCFLDPLLLELFDADGMVACIDGEVRLFGIAAMPESLVAVSAALGDRLVDGVADSNTLSELELTGPGYAGDVSGAMYICLGTNRRDSLLLLRRELVKTTLWAGNPDTAVSADALDRLHPRGSFAAWQKEVRGTSRPWSEANRESAAMLRVKVLRLIDDRRLSHLNASLEKEITQRKADELELAEGADRLALAVRAGSVGIWEWDFVHSRVVWDDQMFRLYGINRTEVMRRSSLR